MVYAVPDLGRRSAGLWAPLCSALSCLNSARADCCRSSFDGGTNDAGSSDLLHHRRNITPFVICRHARTPEGFNRAKGASYAEAARIGNVYNLSAGFADPEKVVDPGTGSSGMRDVW